jgi:hypothetical protein
MNYEDWEAGVPTVFKEDSLWKMEVYRQALFAADLGWHDVTKLMKDRRIVGLLDQLYRALGSVSANIAEGYSRGTGKDRARFYESRDWYYKGRHLLGEAVTIHRLELLTNTIRLLLKMIPQQRNSTIRESEAAYDTDNSNIFTAVPLP